MALERSQGVHDDGDHTGRYSILRLSAKEGADERTLVEIRMQGNEMPSLPG
jgi:hypothetical protein